MNQTKDDIQTDITPHFGMYSKNVKIIFFLILSEVLYFVPNRGEHFYIQGYNLFLFVINLLLADIQLNEISVGRSYLKYKRIFSIDFSQNNYMHYILVTPMYTSINGMFTYKRLYKLYMLFAITQTIQVSFCLKIIYESIEHFQHSFYFVRL